MLASVMGGRQAQVQIGKGDEGISKAFRDDSFKSLEMCPKGL